MKKYAPWLAISILVVVTLACQFQVSPITINPEAIPTAFSKVQETLFAPTSRSTSAATATEAVIKPIQPVSSPTSAPPAAGNVTKSGDDALISLYQKVSPGVVAILTLSQQGGGLGSGFVYDKKGHIITNYHVVEGASDLEVDFPSGLKVRGKVIASDLDSDLAVIEVKAPENELVPLALGDSDKIQVGQTVIAIGNPFGLNGTLTSGIISAKGRTLESLRQTEGGTYFSAGDIIQTDASINPGNSGGPLLNLNGEVIGINRAIRTTSTTADGDPVNSGIGFAISVNIVKRVVPYLIQNGKYDYPYLGITAREEMSLIVKEVLGLPRTTGAYVISVTPGGPADRAGLKGGSRQTEITGLLAGGDLIIGIDGRPVRVFGEMLSYLMTNKSPGEKVTLTIVRDNQEKEVVVTLAKRP